MKKIIFCITMLGFTSSYGMENTQKISSESIYPADIGYISIEDILKEPIPSEVKDDVETLLKSYSDSFNIKLEQQYELSSDIVTEYTLQACAQKDKERGQPLVITPSQKHCIWLPSRVNQVMGNISSLMYDPYTSPERNNPVIIKRALNYQPTVQNLTRVVAQRLLKRFNSDTVKAIESYVYPLYKESKPFDDRFHIPVYETPSTQYKFLHQLTSDESKKFCEEIDLEDFYAAIRYISFAFPDKNHLLVNIKDNTVLILDLESPNNEGYGPESKYGKAIIEGTPKSLNKALHNIDNEWDGGRRTFESVLKEYCPARVDEWNDLYKPKESSIK